MATEQDAIVVETFAETIERLGSTVPVGARSRIRRQSTFDPDIDAPGAVTPRVQEIFIADALADRFNAAAGRIAKEVGEKKGLSTRQLRDQGLWPRVGAPVLVDGQTVQDEIRGLAQQARAQATMWRAMQPGKARDPKPKQGNTLLWAGGLALAGVWLLKQMGEDTEETMGEVPFGALSQASKSRSLRVGLLGGVAGLGALGGSYVLKDTLFGPITGGIVGATAAAALSQDKFQLDIPQLAIYGAASGISGALLADQFTADADPKKLGSFFSRAALGAFFGGGAAALAADGLVPMELRLIDDDGPEPPAPVDIEGAQPLPEGLSLVDAPPDEAVDVSGFVNL